MTRLTIGLIAVIGLTVWTAGEVQAREAEKVTGAGAVELAVYEAGNPDGPPILFIHGFLMSHLSWEAQFSSDLADEFRLVSLDLRGHGASDKPLEAGHYTDSRVWAEDLDAVIRAKDLKRPVLVGWSYGGYVMADYLRVFGDDAVGGLVFVGATSQMGTEKAEGFLGDEFLGGIGAALSEDLATRIQATREFVPLLTSKPMDRDAYEETLAGAMVVPPTVRRGLFNRELDNDEVLAGAGVPTLVVHGGADRIVRLSAAEHVAGRVPEAELRVYEGTGHAVQLDSAERFNRDLARFVRETRRDP